ncbi:RNA polymerase sigma factor [Aliamphritea hakodatensis]|uniref:RNA polymerase sigma factor n=1 Tax=Aliamphritea hakodatensis TaxID=2895352 RepID=UPI0022FD4C6A|nr:sigma-70 family RNA polymerase sigma factor [Aliamphritea hakodatensis]
MSSQSYDVALEDRPPEAVAQQGGVLENWYRQYRQALLLQIQGQVKHRHIAEELLHETFIRLSRMPALDTIRQVKPFIHKVAGNVTVDYLRARHRTPETESDDILQEWASDDPGALESIALQREIDSLRAAIEQLPPRSKETLLLARFREMPLREVARELGISQTMVEKHLKNALQKCRHALLKDLN